MIKNEMSHLRCEVCDFCLEAPSTFNSSITTKHSDLTPAPFNVAMREGRALCNACYHAEIEISIDDVDFTLTKPPKHGTMVYEECEVKTYPPTHHKLTYYKRKGITEKQKESWRNEYVASLRSKPTKPGGH